MQRGPTRSATNPSAALMGRIRDAKNGVLRPLPNGHVANRTNAAAAAAAVIAARQQPAQSAPPALGPAEPKSEIDKFVHENQLDGHAASTLKNESDEVIKTVIVQ